MTETFKNKKLVGLSGKEELEVNLLPELRRRMGEVHYSKVMIQSTTAERGLFDAIEAGVLSTGNFPAHYINSERKPVSITTPQFRIILYLCEEVYKLLQQDEHIKEYAAKVPSAMAKLKFTKAGEELKKPIFHISPVALAKAIYGEKAGGKQISLVTGNIIKMASILQRFSATLKDGTVVTFYEPLINFKRGVDIERGKVKVSCMEVELSHAFFYNLEKLYIKAPSNILQLWNEYGKNTDIFGQLYTSILNARWNVLDAAKNAVSAKRKELKKERLPEEDIQAELEKIKTERLTFKISVPTLLNRLNSDKKYFKTTKGKKYFNNDKFNADLKECKEGLMGMGIIKDMYTTKGVESQTICNFVLNENWIEEQQKKLQMEDAKEEKR